MHVEAGLVGGHDLAADGRFIDERDGRTRQGRRCLRVGTREDGDVAVEEVCRGNIVWSLVGVRKVLSLGQIVDDLTKSRVANDVGDHVACGSGWVDGQRLVKEKAEGEKAVVLAIAFALHLARR